MEPEKKMNLGKTRIQISKGNMDYKVRTTFDDIKDIKLETEKYEKDRKIKEEARRVQRMNEIQAEGNECARNVAALEMKWANMRENEEECEELKIQIEEQKKLFEKVKAEKQRLIDEFEEEKRKKDNEYRKMLKEQSLHIETMIEKMRNQFFDLRDRYLEELKAIESDFINDRDALLKAHLDQLEDKFKRHEEMELGFVEAKDKREEINTKTIDDLRIDGAKTYTDFKISMETEIQNLEKCYEDMKAMFILNQEKLEYNLKVLSDMKNENKILYEDLRKKDHTLTEALRILKDNYKDADKDFKMENKMQTQKYKSITRQFKDLQKKVKHFEKADLDRYKEIQKMNEAEVQKLKEKILKCDITIHVQQLGEAWVINEEPEIQEGASKIEKDKTISENKEGMKDDEIDKEFELDIDEENLVKLIDMLIEETSFLLDDKICEDLKIETINEEDSLKIKLETVKKCLSIDSIEEMNLLLQFLDEKQRQKKMKQRVIENEGNPEEKLENEIKLEEHDEEVEYGVSDIRNELTEFLHEFMTNKDQRKKLLAIKQESDKEKKERIAREGKKYWEKLTQVLPEKKIRIWKMLEVALTKYYDLLLQRQKLIEETGDLHNQNEELKNLLNQYIQINHELIIPPTKLIRLEPN